jgi:hypothetical protein
MGPCGRRPRSGRVGGRCRREGAVAPLFQQGGEVRQRACHAALQKGDDGSEQDRKDGAGEGGGEVCGGPAGETVREEEVGFAVPRGGATRGAGVRTHLGRAAEFRRSLG